ncbi:MULTISPECIES: thiamine phosphate synthase [Paracoccus]|jgi:thiamine-phosphate pyrophosphorylase|uniref:Thiamine phosphate synthase n=1 Tax=Paracoccus haeundaensis TaxID=225362 RepID=A0A5C4R6G7_9RHOB|nr:MULTISPECIES: thiamine phosphate synthase [Paracoccus]AZY94394.1 thiamine phosphate synthase [Paracoccus sp. Arc7-R13]MCO6361668.1 thiamine phosphate synthase [Paracoccus sp. 08]QXI63541.1 Thiamine-phosphate synthase [Paracoccus marcusii]TNC04089.1 thiamine phosphate synthase [Paracoccus marcusii]TNH39251.1 thiamine phosphate synthase [Paracoccus haeundaensis]|tara:strand:+ start:358 stop:960 length:603 start_codon:yes stop_codon:yes gene_type:complete
MTDAPQLYLMTPAGAQASSLAPMLAEVMDRVAPACLRIRGGAEEDELGRLADMAREIAHARDVAVVIDDHVKLALRHGLDGVHLNDGAKAVRYARKELGDDAIVGAFCGTSRHEGMNAAEAGADYVAFGPVSDSALYRGDPVELELFQWWSEMIEVPVVAEGAITRELITQLTPITDFIALGPEIWTQEDPAATLALLWG